MKHRVLALFCALFLLISAIPSVGALEGDDLRAADALATLDMVHGNQQGSYALNQTASRAQAAVLLTRLAGKEQEARSAQSAGYQDLPGWAAKQIDFVTAQGWISNTAPLFEPEHTMGANLWCTALLRMLGYSAQDFNSKDAALFAQHIGLTSQLCQNPLTRGVMFETALEALVFPGKSGTPLIESLIASGTVARSTANALGLTDHQLTLREAADRHLSAVFSMDCYVNKTNFSKKVPDSMASGFFVTTDGIAVTNYHSFAGSRYATATLITGEVYPVEEVLWYDVDMDLALIRVSKTSLDEETTSGFAFMELATTEHVRAGDTVYTIGNPLGFGLTVSQGVVGAVGRKIPGYTLPCIVNSADISHGSSGGVLMNTYGQVIGVTAGAYINGNSMYIAVPVGILSHFNWPVEGKSLGDVLRAEESANK